MVLGSRIDGGTQFVPLRIRKTIQSIKEIVGNHSDADIYAVLKETNMDPNETTQKLLTQDPFHEVKRRRDKKKEPTGYRGLADTRRHVEPNAQRANSHTTQDVNLRKGDYMQYSVPRINKQFRVVRDNRVSQNAKNDIKQGTLDQSISSISQTMSNAPEKRTVRDLSAEELSIASTLDGYILSAGPGKSTDGSHNAKDAGSSGSQMSFPRGEAKGTVLSKLQGLHNSSQVHSKMASSNSDVGVYSSSSDPVHVPSADSRSAGIVGAIRRDVGAVGAQRRSSDHRVSQSTASSNSFSISLLGKEISSQTELSGHSTTTFKSTYLEQVSTPMPTLPSSSLGRSILGSHQNNKVYQQSVGNQKVTQTNMEWKPKATQKPNIVVPGAVGTDQSASSCTDNLHGANLDEIDELSDKLSNFSASENLHVIIPRHLQVPESELARLTFGSFEVGLDSNNFSPANQKSKGLIFGSFEVGFDSNRVSSVNQQSQNADDFVDVSSVSAPASAPIISTEGPFASSNGNKVDVQSRVSQSDYPASVAEPEELSGGNSESISSQHIESYAEIGLIRTGSPPYSSTEDQLQNPENLSNNFSAYDNQSGYDVPFLRTVLEDNVHTQDLASSSEALNSLAASFSPLSSMSSTQQQQFINQPQSLPQMYPQVHIPHYPNFVPYRHVFSPVYVPPIAMPNYSSNPPYPHPPNGNNYLVMPGGSSQIAAGSMKYAPAQYKPLPAGSPTAYASYNNSAFTISSTGAVGTAGLEDFSRMKYKDSSLYVPNQQAETSDIWIQTPRELPSLQSAPYYNLTGQAPHAAFMPTHAGHASFSAAAPIPHVQYPGIYHPTQPASMATPHQLVHHQVTPAIGGGVGPVGVAAPGPQVGTYQTPQLSHLNWNANF